MKEFTEDDLDIVDGYDELPADAQEKVRFALRNGHVQDEDWKGVSVIRRSTVGVAEKNRISR